MAYEANTKTGESAGTCPFAHSARRTQKPTNTEAWWPERLSLRPLYDTTRSTDPHGRDFDYAAAFESIDLDALKKDVIDVMTTSQDWWPADYGHYGPLFIRMAWHGAGTYRIHDGRGGAGSGAIRLGPHDSWPDNVNIDKARRLLWPIKQKYGRALSWADLMIFAGTMAIEHMGLKAFGFAGGRRDAFEPDEHTYWGPEQEWLGGKERFSGSMRELDKPLANSQMGLIYVNPEGPDGDPDPERAAHDIRVTFSRMAMNDEETVALIAGGHTFGKSHGAASEDHLAEEPQAADVTLQGLGWKNSFETGAGPHTITGGPEGAWTSNPTKWDLEYLQNLFGYTWKKAKSPAGAWQWHPEEPDTQDKVPDAHLSDTRHPPMMFTTDIALKVDPSYRQICERFLKDPDAFGEAFSRAWYKLVHRDMGPRQRFLGDWVPDEELLWMDPIPDVDHPLVGEADVAELKRRILATDLSISELVSTAWAAAACYRDTDKRGGANGGRLRLAPQKDWEVNQPEQVSKVLGVLEGIQQEFHAGRSDDVRVSLADLIVLGGCAAVEAAARNAGHDVSVPFAPGRADASQEQTDTESFAVLEPKADGFRNYARPGLARTPEELLVERAEFLRLSVPQMTVLLGGLRVLGANHGGASHGVLTENVGHLSNDFFVNLLDVGTAWTPSDTEGVFEGRDRGTGELRWTATRADLVFGSHDQLRAEAEYYGASDGQEAFVRDFVAAWDHVMNLDRFDLER